MLRKYDIEKIPFTKKNKKRSILTVELLFDLVIWWYGVVFGLYYTPDKTYYTANITVPCESDGN
jgi:hypothetical protein